MSSDTQPEAELVQFLAHRLQRALGLWARQLAEQFPELPFVRCNDRILAFEPPRPVIRDWHDVLGAEFGYDDLAPHLEAIRTLLRIGPVPESQISGSNLALRQGVRTLGLPHHGPTQRNAHQCIGCGFCDLGCRYNRKLTPLNIVLPLAARHGAQVVANCRVDGEIDGFASTLARQDDLEIRRGADGQRVGHCDSPSL